MSHREPADFFSLHTPCGNCPFRNDREFHLSRHRREEIAGDLTRGEVFFCHKTVAYGGAAGNATDTTDTTQARACAGAREVATRSGYVSQSEQVARRLGFDVTDVRDDAPVYQHLDDWVAVANQD